MWTKADTDGLLWWLSAFLFGALIVVISTAVLAWREERRRK